MKHPNTIAGGSTGLVATGVVWLLNRYAGMHLNTYEGGIIITLVTSTILFIGRRGIKGTVRDVWNGVVNGSAPSGRPPQALRPPFPPKAS